MSPCMLPLLSVPSQNKTIDKSKTIFTHHFDLFNLCCAFCAAHIVLLEVEHIQDFLFWHTGWQISKSCWFWFQIWHQLIILFGFWIGTSPYPDFSSVLVSNIIIISHDDTFQDRLFSLKSIVWKIYKYICF